ncbi:Hypothetical predicted protein [Mytilus galloprovincialis]|uniref:Uncharacterized protein n=1 Tax=Mytilus galloprovincialis TaxID=29158 RepID=A0A8B6EMX7_MYTGA|nr:Hypothetical predicted protein [Mytilus galloprovincialis]
MSICLQDSPSNLLILLTPDELSQAARRVNHDDADTFEEAPCVYPYNAMPYLQPPYPGGINGHRGRPRKFGNFGNSGIRQRVTQWPLQSSEERAFEGRSLVDLLGHLDLLKRRWNIGDFFLDEWKGYSKLRPAFHNRIELVTDSSIYRYGALLNLGEKHLTIGDYWSVDDTIPIHEKEGQAILKALQSLGKSLIDSRADVLTYSMAVSTVDMSVGYLFRIVSEKGRVLDKAVSYSVMYERLRYYLSLLGIYKGETPHSFRSGCAITMALSGAAENEDQEMKHSGWFGRAGAEYYRRIHTLVVAESVALRLSQVVGLKILKRYFKNKLTILVWLMFLTKSERSIHNDNAAASNEPTSMAIGAIVATGVLCGIGAILCIGGLVLSCKKCVTDGIIV